MSNNATSAVNQQGSSLSASGGYSPSETIRRIPQMNRNLAMLLGMLFTDGCVSPNGNSWRIYFANKSKSLVDLFQECIIEIFGLSANRVLKGITADGLFRAVINSKEIGNYLVDTFGTFRTLKFKDGRLPKTKLPVLELLASDCTGDFLRVAFSCDGGLCFYPARRGGSLGGTKWLIRTVFLACAHPRLRADYMFLLKSLGIEAREVVGDRKIKLETGDSIKKFHRMVGFVKGVKSSSHSKFWVGYAKQDVLELMIASYDNPSRIYNLPKFHLR